MSKKYVPSGYQIINLNLEHTSDEDFVLPEETEDEKLLYSLCRNGIKKPLLFGIELKLQGGKLICVPDIEERSEDVYFGTINFRNGFSVLMDYLSGDDEIKIQIVEN